jgi:hypothetical protein
MFIAAGSVGLLYHLSELKALPFRQGLVWVSFVRFLAILGGVFLLRGFNWARWLLVGWLAFHVFLSFLHSRMEVVMHGFLLAVIAYFLFRSQASAYFRRRSAEPQMPEK